SRPAAARRAGRAARAAIPGWRRRRTRGAPRRRPPPRTARRPRPPGRRAPRTGSGSWSWRSRRGGRTPQAWDPRRWRRRAGAGCEPGAGLLDRGTEVLGDLEQRAPADVVQRHVGQEQEVAVERGDGPPGQLDGRGRLADPRGRRAVDAQPVQGALAEVLVAG